MITVEIPENKKWKNDFSPIDVNLGEISKNYSKAYLRHLIINKEMLGSQIASIHNLQFYMWLINQSRIHILDDSFYPSKSDKARIKNYLMLT